MALESQKETYQKSKQTIEQVERKFNLPIKTWLGWVQGNDELDILHPACKRLTFIADHHVSFSKVHYMIIWNHGMNGFDKGEFETRTFPQLSKLISRNISFTWVHPELPWSANSKNINARRAWQKKDSFYNFVNAATENYKIPEQENRFVIVGHSRGGKSIAEASRTGDLCKFKLHYVVWSDASYGRWLDDSWQKCLKDADAKIEVFYIKNTETQASVKRVEKLAKQHIKFIGLLFPLWYHRKVGNSIFEISEALK